MSWSWDETLFAGAAAHYERGRLPYAPGLAAALAAALGLDGTGRLLDVGCGPGTVALLLAGHYAGIVGLDPDADMLAEAGAAAAEAGLDGKSRWVKALAEVLPAGLGEFTTVTFAQSFHWMDQDLVAATAAKMLAPGGAIVHIADLKDEVRSTEGLPHPPVPYEAIQDLVREHLGPVRRAGRGFLPHGTPGGEAEVFARAGLTGPEDVIVPGGAPVERGTDDVIAWVFSTSSSAPHLFAERLDAFEADLRALLGPGPFAERLPSTHARIWRTA
ncbi:methyltransferase [Actinorhabdospora filicis]|uniref:Methyltransferase n=1 Tax=Actinorhabdospora filicis TaxID=1785913 RepID=A0A9W6W374_9ACTN|nr:class I SAM-dependent methyltransferase [Actinorhabdospora filicis]GLZ77827.1 methyltransferase [Actinorhabdospora filicis]